MTTDQKKALKSHVTWHKPIPKAGSNGEIYWLEDGMVVEFTDCESYSTNSRFQINHGSNRYIWFSQLSNTFIEDDLTFIYAVMINKDKEAKQIRDFSDWEFWNEVKGKKYQVETDGPFYTINAKSLTAEEKQLFSDFDIYNYVKKCVEQNRINDIGDCLKTSKAYHLTQLLRF